MKSKSKVKFQKSLSVIVLCLAGLLFCDSVAAQNAVAVTLEVSADRRGEVKIEIETGAGRELPVDILFPSAAGQFAISRERVRSIEAFDGERAVSVVRVGSLQYAAGSKYNKLKIIQELFVPPTVDAAAFHSWMSDGKGLLFLADLLPLIDTSKGKVPTRIRLLDGFGSAGSSLTFDDINAAVVPFGPGEDGFIGDWPFTKSDAEMMASEIVLHYSKNVFGAPAASPRFIFMRLSDGFAGDRWAAQTIGSTVLIVSTGTAFPTQEKQRLHEQLRHEIFHLWFPNGAGLKGRYDWFYEGYALYESLKFAVNSNRITFENFLSTIGGAKYIASKGNADSLLALSAGRVVGGDAELYAKGILVGFFTDVAMLDASSGKRSSSDLVKDVFAAARRSPGASANDLILEVFSLRPELRSVTGAYLKGEASLDASRFLAAAGLKASADGVSVVEKPTSRQKTVLEKLGYNAWRKLAGEIK